MSLDDFIRRVKLCRDDIIALCPAGVFDHIADGLARSNQARRLLSANTGTEERGQNDLFAAETKPSFGSSAAMMIAPTKEKWVQKTDTDRWEEYHALVFLQNTHPLALWKYEVLAVKYRVKARYIGEYIGRSVKMIGWPVTPKEVWTKDGLTMI